MRLYFDEDTMSRALLRAARSVGFDAVTAVDVAMDGRSDEEQLSFATEQGRTVVTSNRADFARLNTRWAQSGIAHAGIIILTRQGMDIGLVLRKLQRIDQRHPDTTNLFEFI